MINKTRKLEFFLGLSVIIFVVAIVLSLVFNFFDFKDHTTQNYYKVQAVFKDMQGIDVHSNVKISGVNVGYVSGYYLNTEDYYVVMDIMIDNTYKNLAIDTLFSIKQDGLFGEYYIDIKPGYDKELIPHGELVYNTKQSITLDDLVSILLTKFI